MVALLRVALATLGVMAAAVAPALAQGAWPQKPVRIIVPFPAGGSNDTLCRIVGEKLGAAWQQPVIVDNKPGAGGNVGAEIAFHAEPNGYTLLCSPPHLSAEMFLRMTGVDLVHVPYKGEGPALVDIVAGRVDIFIGNLAAALRFQKAKQVKFLGLTARSRSPVAPEVPDAAEIGLPDLIASAWFAVVAPPGTPDTIVRKINADATAALQFPDVRARFLEQGAEPRGESTAATAAFIKDEEARWRSVIDAADVKLE